MAYRLINDLEEILHGDPAFFVRAAIAPFFMVLSWKKYIHPLPTFCISKGRESYIIINEKEYFATAIEKFRDFYTKKISINDLLAEYEPLRERITKEYERLITTDFAVRSDDDLKEIAKLAVDLFAELAEKTIYIETIDLEKIIDVVKEEDKTRIEAIWERATENTFVSFEGRRQKKLLDIISLRSQHSVDIAKYIFTDYFWVKNDIDIAKHIAHIEQNIEEKKKESVRIYAAIQEKQTQSKLWLMSLDEDLRRVAEYVQLAMRYRDERKDQIAQIHAVMTCFSVEMLKRAGIDPKHAPYVLLYEYIQGIEYLKIKKEDIEKRINGCMYVVYHDYSCKTELCDYDNAIAEFTALANHDLKIDTLHGQIACRGKVRGSVRIISDPHEDKGFQTGDILVTSMTRPEYIPIMKKAGAVVTNEGGITCHAAIVSRELNIPCIIGTKIATQVLKDGDMVEVDAINGIVTILKNH